MTRGEKILLFLLILSLIILGLVLAYLAFLFITVEKVCESPNCIKASAKLLENIDFSKDPCTEFEKFICNNNIPNSLSFRDDTDLKKLALISAPVADSDRDDLVTVKSFYQACTNPSDQENAIATVLSRVGGWPILLESKWKESNFSWQWFMGEVRRYGIKNDWLISFDYYKDSDGKNLLLIQPPNLKPSRNRDNLVYLEEIILKLSAQLGYNVAVPTSKISELLDFEKGLVRITDHAKTKQQKYTKIRVENLNEIWPNINLAEILNNLARGYSVFTNSTVIVVASETYLYRLHALLGRTSNRTQVNYFLWKTIEEFLPFLPTEIREIHAKYFDLATRESQCFEETIRRFYSIVETSYTDEYKEEETITALENLVSLIKSNTNVNILGADAPHSGFTDISFKSQSIIKMITEVQFKADNEFFKCIHRQASTCTKQSYYDPLLSYTQSETSYNIEKNTINLPYNLAYSDFFRWDQPNYINFARIGQAISDAINEATNSSSPGGLSVAHKAYGQWVQIEGSEDKLPALNYTTNQLFWIHSSILYCSLDDEEKEDKFRAVKEMSYFKQDFQCQ